MKSWYTMGRVTVEFFVMRLILTKERSMCWILETDSRSEGKLCGEMREVSRTGGLETYKTMRSFIEEGGGERRAGPF